jgi:hypothetical protein
MMGADTVNKDYRFWLVVPRFDAIDQLIEKTAVLQFNVHGALRIKTYYFGIMPIVGDQGGVSMRALFAFVISDAASLLWKSSGKYQAPSVHPRWFAASNEGGRDKGWIRRIAGCAGEER